VHCGSPVLRAYRKVQSVGLSYMLPPNAGASTMRLMERVLYEASQSRVLLEQLRLVRNALA